MMYRSILAVAIVLQIALAHAQQPSSACKLLQVAEIESALGGTVKKTPSGFSQGGIDSCTIEMRGKSGARVITIFIAKDLPTKPAIRAGNEGLLEADWKDRGGRLEHKTLGNAACQTNGLPGAPWHSTCILPRGNGYIEVDVRGPVEELVPMETVAALAELLAGRL
jgi:hypothetical protein